MSNFFNAAVDRWTDDVHKVDPEDIPSIVYHYTDASGLMGILTSGEVWLTDYRFLNDKSEMEHTLQSVRDLIRVKQDTITDKLLTELYDKVRSYWNTNSLGDVYVFSLAEDGDDLSQWRGYAHEGMGFTVGFCGPSLARIAAYEKPGFSLCQVEYDYEKQQETLKSALADFEEALRSEIKELPSLENLFIDQAASWFDLIARIRAVANKHSSFKSEKEWRLIKVIEEEDPENKVKARISGLRLIRYVEAIPRIAGEEKLPIKRIGIGPGFAGKEDIYAVQALCKQTGYDLEIYFADTPYRRL